MPTDSFYANLAHLDYFPEVSEPSKYAEIPPDWYVIAADVQGSTLAIQAGRYKEVNTVGVSVITCILNIAKPLDIPYVFGGDGASLCIPASLLAQAQQALASARQMAREAYGLHLRVGIVPIADIIEAGHRVLVARHQVSRHYVQAAFTGGGLEFAEECIKGKHGHTTYCLEEASKAAPADFSGLECRWRPIPSQHEETIALLVKAMGSSDAANAKIYHEVIMKVSDIYGTVESCRPVTLEGLRLTTNAQNLNAEIRVRTYGRDWLKKLTYGVLLRVTVLLGKIMMRYGLLIGGVSWGEYKPTLIANTDFRKFDDMLREILAGTVEQRVQLSSYLDARFRARELVYGIHPSPSALMTCLINDYGREHFHFVDGSDGGYAMAAMVMKEQLNSFG